jgi:AcrR family transcriptional regulator
VTATARPYHHGSLRPALLEAAERALDRGGVQALSLRELAREIGVSHAAPRRHFADKQALLDALAEDGFERLGHAMTAAVDAAGDHLEPRLKALARTYVRFATDHAPLLDLMYAGKHRPGAERLRESADRAFEAPLRLITEAAAKGEIVASDALQVGIVTWSTFHGIAAMANNGMLGDAPLEPLVDDAVEQLLRGLRPR